MLFQIYSNNYVLAVQFVPPQIAGGGKIKKHITHFYGAIIITV